MKRIASVTKLLMMQLLAPLLAPILVWGGLQSVTAEVTDFGGWPDRFKGDGDKEPPRCQINIPAGSKTPFFILWDCSDNEADREDIRTELWIYKKDAPAGELVKQFLGFPAFVSVDAPLLGVQNFTDGLPASFRLIATDRAGVSAISSSFSVNASANSIATCDLLVVTEATESTGSTTGIPSQTLQVVDGAVTAAQFTDSQISIASSGAVPADPCEIESLCEDSEVSFNATVTLDNGTASGTVSIGSGVTAELTGTSVSDGDVTTELDLSGTTEIDGTTAEVTMTCSD